MYSSISSSILYYILHASHVCSASQLPKKETLKKKSASPAHSPVSLEQVKPTTTIYPLAYSCYGLRPRAAAVEWCYSSTYREKSEYIYSLYLYTCTSQVYMRSIVSSRATRGFFLSHSSSSSMKSVFPARPQQLKSVSQATSSSSSSSEQRRLEQQTDPLALWL